MISLREVTKTYRTRQGIARVLNGVNLDVRPGERVGILGRNGAGKSTLIRLISGAESPTSGRIHRGMSVSWPLAFGGAFQSSLSGLDNFRFICRIYGTDYRGGIGFLHDFTELGPYLREPIKTYSSGMRARLAFAISMVVEFQCFLIDEVIAVGDDDFRAKCLHELFEKRGDRALIVASHNPEFIQTYCSRTVLLSDGVLADPADTVALAPVAATLN